MEGLTSYIASLSMNMAQASVQSNASVKMLKNTIDSAQSSGAQLIETLNDIPAPAAGVGSLLDVRA